jgi:hypothetical protein
MTPSKGPNELPPNGKKPATRAISIGYWRYIGKTSFSNLPAFEQCQDKRAAYSEANRRSAITGDGYWSCDLISIVQWVMYSLASIASPWNIALPTDCTASNL